MATFMKWMGMGTANGITSKSVNTSDWLASVSDERYYGFENFGNTCYCNSVLQALYFCKPFRECVQNYSYPMSAALLAAASENIPFPSNYDARSIRQGINQVKLASSSKQSEIPAPDSEDNLFSALQELFIKIGQQKKKTGVVAPVNFVNKLKKENELFRSSMHQDAHEFLNYTLNAIAEILLRHKKDATEWLNSTQSATDTSQRKANANSYVSETWVHELFEGKLTNETKCRTCETVTNREEPFLDLSVDIEQHSSLSSCLRNFSTSETLCSKNKFFCNKCGSLQEAEKRMKVKKLPNILAVHLKRFKYQERLQRYIKLAYRVVFPLELKLFNTADDADDSDRLYTLRSVIVHVGSGPYHGHYTALVKSNDQWVLFDDDSVEPIDEADLMKYVGDPTSPGTGYIFFYERVGFNSKGIVKAMKSEGEAVFVESKLDTTDTASTPSTTASPPPLTTPTPSEPGLKENSPEPNAEPPTLTQTNSSGGFSIGKLTKRKSVGLLDRATLPNQSDVSEMPNLKAAWFRKKN